MEHDPFNILRKVIRRGTLSLALSILIFSLLLPTGPGVAKAEKPAGPSVNAGVPARNAILAWTSFLGGINHDIGNDIASDSSGNLYVTGNSSATWGNPVRAYTAYDDAFVAKLSPEGALLWVTFLGGISADTGDAIAVDGSGNVFVAGRSRAAWGDPLQAFTSYPLDKYDGFIAKLDPNGSKLWHTFLGGSGDEYTADVSLGSDGSLYISGQASASWGNAIRSYTSSYDLFLAKFSSTGSLQWNTFLGGYGDEGGGNISLNSADEIYVTGTTNAGWGSPIRPYTPGSSINNYDRDAFVVKLDPAGNLQWNTFLGGSALDSGYGISVDRNNNIYVSGSSVLSWDTPVRAFTPSHLTYPADDAFIVKLSPDGQFVWNTFLGGNEWDYGYGIAVDESGIVYLTGRSDTSWGSPVRPITGSDAFIAAVNADGVLQWNTFLGGSGSDYGVGLLSNMNSTYIVGSSDATWGTPVRPYSHNSDSFVAKLGPFLDLPLQYSNFAEAVLGSNRGVRPGYVNSWFDHQSPNYSLDGYIYRWDGFRVSDPADIKCTFGWNCYDGHNGIDFSHDKTQENESVYAAADGTVFGVINDCSGCKTSYGNRVWINHGNGYATLYGHLASVLVEDGAKITNRLSQPLGIMGSTGNSTGTHLHFGVYFDQNQDGTWSENEAVDPYGWPDSIADPWIVPSSYLWRHALDSQYTSDSAGGTYSPPSGRALFNIPAGALSQSVTLELGDVAPRSEPSDQLRSTGYSFLVKVLQWLSGNNSSNKNYALSIEGTSTNSFNAPVTITIKFDPLSMPHINLNGLIIQQWDETGKSWVALSTVTNPNESSAQTMQPGYFDLQGPLVCPADILEPNDNYDGSSIVQTDGSQISSLFDIAQDEDWFQIDAFAGTTYQIQTAELANGVDTVLEIYDGDGVSILASDNDSGSGQASLLIWQAPQNGTYFIRVFQASGSSYGCTSSYKINISPLSFKTSIDIGGVNSGNYDVLVHGSRRQSYTSINNGPVQVTSSGSPSISSQRVIYGGWSYSEMMGLPFDQLSKEYLFPYYNNVAMDSQLRVSNVGNADTTIKIYLGSDPNPIDSYTLAAGGATRKNYTGKNSGPLRVTSSASDILATIRVLYNGSSYSEMMGLPVELLTKEYIFPYYNNVAMDSQLRVSNVDGAETMIKVYLGSNPDPIDQYTLAAGGATRKNYTGKNSGPLRVTSSDSNILTTIRVLYANQSLSELMGFPTGQLAKEYWYPVYDNTAVDSQLRVSNVGTNVTTITVYAGAEQIDNYTLNAGAATRKNYPKNTGPLHVVSSSQPILTTIRMLYSGNSYYEMAGLPEGQLSTQYFFPWYNNYAMNSELRVAVP
jgi:murein DD-endopeptidase MepM/ murein hydrolase activator NlpD